MSSNLIAQFITAKLELSEKLLRMLPDPGRSRVTAFRDTLVESLHEATGTFLHPKGPEQNAKNRCTPVSID